MLGDDIVIADTAVAEKYLEIMDLLGVDIGLAKSLVSPKGKTLEFAKRTFWSGSDVSPVPFSEYWVGRQMLSAGLELVRKYDLTLQQWLDLNGFGYVAKGSVQGNLTSLGQRLRHKILAYFSPGMPSGYSIKVFFSMKSLESRWKWTNKKVATFIEKFLRQEVARVEDSMNSNSFNALIGLVKDLVTVNRDREYYGTLSRSYPGARKLILKDLLPGDSWEVSDEVKSQYDEDLYYHVVDSLVETVYRESYFDILVRIRELKESIIVLKERTQLSLDDVEGVVKDFQTIQDELSLIPLPKEIYRRVEAKTRLANLEMIKQWEVYSRVLRSTRST